jgi:hypothetical protein
LTGLEPHKHNIGGEVVVEAFKCLAFALDSVSVRKLKNCNILIFATVSVTKIITDI